MALRTVSYIIILLLEPPVRRISEYVECYLQNAAAARDVVRANNTQAKTIVHISLSLSHINFVRQTMLIYYYMLLYTRRNWFDCPVVFDSHVVLWYAHHHLVRPAHAALPQSVNSDRNDRIVYYCYIMRHRLYRCGYTRLGFDRLVGLKVFETNRRNN